MSRGVKIGADRYDLVLLKVTSKDEFGRPLKCDIGYDDTTFQLEGGEEFITCFVPSKLVKPKTRGNA